MGYIKIFLEKHKKHLTSMAIWPYIKAIKTIEKLSPRAGAVAQLGEHRTCTAEVAGSNPVSSTNKITKEK